MTRQQGTAQSAPQLPAKRQDRVQISRVEPEIEGGRYPIKRVVDDVVQVAADIVVDGHNALAAVLLYALARRLEIARTAAWLAAQAGQTPP